MKGILYIQRAPSRLCCFRLLSWGNGRTMAMYTDSRERLADLRGDALNANHALRSLSHVHSSGGGGPECRRPRKEISFFFQPRCIISFAIGRPSSGAYSLHIKPFRRRPYLLFFFSFFQLTCLAISFVFNWFSHPANFPSIGFRVIGGRKERNGISRKVSGHPERNNSWKRGREKKKTECVILLIGLAPSVLLGFDCTSSSVSKWTWWACGRVVGINNR
jgi:hypothetical protein